MSLKKPLLENEQLYFVHVPKCAGTTFINVLDQHFTDNEIMPVHYDLKKFQQEITDSQLAGYRFLRGHFPYDMLVPRLPGIPRTITFLREPVTRFISNFEMRQRVPDPLVGMRETLAALSLEQFLDRPDLVKHFANRATRLIGGEIYQENGQPRHNLERAKERMATFDFVGVTEHFDESLELFSYIFNFEPINTYETLNVSPGREKRKEVPQNLLDRVAEVEQYDIELYKFGFEIYKNLREKMLQERAAGNPPVTIGEPAQKVHVNFNRVNPGMGWHVGETSPVYGIVRWSGPETTSKLQFHLRHGQSYIVRFRIIRAVSRDILRSLRLEVNEAVIPLKTRRDGRDHAVICEGTIPQNILTAGHQTTLALKVDRTLPLNYRTLEQRILARLGIDIPIIKDIRQAGFLCHWLEIYPA